MPTGKVDWVTLGAQNSMSHESSTRSPKMQAWHIYIYIEERGEKERERERERERELERKERDRYNDE